MELGPIIPSAELRRTPGLSGALSALLGTVVILTIGYGKFGVKPEILLVFATACVVCISAALGVSWKETQSGMLQSIVKGMPAMLIVIVVGAPACTPTDRTR